MVSATACTSDRQSINKTVHWYTPSWLRCRAAQTRICELVILLVVGLFGHSVIFVGIRKFLWPVRIKNVKKKMTVSIFPQRDQLINRVVLLKPAG